MNPALIKFAIIIVVCIIIAIVISIIWHKYNAAKKAEQAKEGPIGETITDEEREATISFSDYYINGGITTNLCKVNENNNLICYPRLGVPELEDINTWAVVTGATVGTILGAVAGATLGPVGVAAGAAGGGTGGYYAARAMSGEDAIENVPFFEQVDLHNKFRINNAGEGQGGLYTIQNLATGKFCKYYTSDKVLTCNIETEAEAIKDKYAKFAVIYQGEVTPPKGYQCTVDGVCVEGELPGEDPDAIPDPGASILGDNVHVYKYQVAVQSPDSPVEGVFNYCSENEGNTGTACRYTVPSQETVFDFIHFDADDEAAHALMKSGLDSSTDVDDVVYNTANTQSSDE